MTFSSRAARAGPHISVDPQRALADAPVQIRLAGFPSLQHLTLRAQMRDPAGGAWESYATFQTDSQGSVDVATQAPLTGSYDIADSMGLFWSMLPQEIDGASNDDHDAWSPIRITLRAEIDGHLVAETTIERLRALPNVQRRIVRERGLVGTLFQPSDAVPVAGILLLGGSEGGLHELDAALLASHGYAVFALAYFGMEGVAPTLVNIPLEYFATAIAWLREQPSVRTDCLGVLGGSRGGELALLLGATFPTITAVVSYLGSGVITQGIGSGDILAMVNTGQPSWTYHGRPLPFLPSHATPAFEAQVHAGAAVELRPVFLAALDDTTAVEAATIPVEQMNGAVLLISTGDDRIWPNARLSEIAIDRLRRHGHPHPYHQLHYEQAGHGIIAPPYGPTTMLDGPGPGVMFSLGGTPKDNAFARADAWSHMLTFFDQQLHLADAAVNP